MAEQFYTLLTKVGKAKIANASALGTKLNLAKFQVGDSNGSYYNPTEEQTELKNKVWEGVISSITVDENNPNWIVLQTILPGNIGGFMIREAGVFDSEGNLIAIGKYPETYKPQSGDGSTKDLVIKMILEVSNASSVTLKVDPTVILATKKDIEILENKIKDIKIPVASVNNKTGAVELSASDVGAYSKTEVDNKFKGITVPVTKINNKTGDVILSATDIKTSSGQTVESQLADKVIKPTTAIGNNIAIFDTNQDKLKDSGKSIGNTAGKILELPTGLVAGDMLRVGVNGQVERLSKGVDGQGLIIQNGTVKWGNTGCRIAQGRWIDTTTQVPFNSEYIKTIPLGFNAKRGRLYVVSQYGTNADGVITQFICFGTELLDLSYTNFKIKTIGRDGNGNNTVFLDSIQISNDNLVIKSKSVQGYGSTYNTLKVDIGWEVEG